MNKFLEIHKKGDNFEIIRPFIPFHAEILFNPQQGSKKFYLKLTDIKRSEQRHEVKWNLSMICNNHWETIYRVCFRSIPHLIIFTLAPSNCVCLFIQTQNLKIMHQILVIFSYKMWFTCDSVLLKDDSLHIQIES